MIAHGVGTQQKGLGITGTHASILRTRRSCKLVFRGLLAGIADGFC
jgi:hypothetical protein